MGIHLRTTGYKASSCARPG